MENTLEFNNNFNNNFKNNLIDNLKNKKAVITVIGLGYVGLPLALSFAEVGFKVIGLDIDQNKINRLLNKESYIGHIEDERIAKAINSNFTPSADFSLSTKADCLIICVPTPLNAYREPDLSYVTGTMDSLSKYFKKGQMLVLESTTYPGTTHEVLRPLIEEKGFVIGQDYFLVFSPEREDPANPNFNTKNIAKVLGGETENCTEIGVALYAGIINKVVPVSSTQAAELTKLLENIYRAVNIGLVNELKIVADKMGLDIYEVIDAAATKPFGFTPFYPGPGIGGHCIPVDPFYLTWKARAFGLHTRFIELAGEINCSMPIWVVKKIFYALNKKSLPLRGSKILILGLAYKKNVDDMRESPSVEIMSLLKKEGALIDYSDPYIPVFPKIRKADFDLKSVPITKKSLANYDAVVLLTDHESFDFDLILKNASLIIDTRGVYKNENNVVKA